MTNQEKIADAQEKCFLEAFKTGVATAFNYYNIPFAEYTSLFWGNVHGSEFESYEQALACGFEAAEHAILEHKENKDNKEK